LGWRDLQLALFLYIYKVLPYFSKFDKIIIRIVQIITAQHNKISWLQKRFTIGVSCRSLIAARDIPDRWDAKLLRSRLRRQMSSCNSNCVKYIRLVQMRKTTSEEDPEGIRNAVYQGAKDVIATLPGRIVYLNRVFNSNLPPANFEPTAPTLTIESEVPTGAKRRREEFTDGNDLPRLRKILAAERNEFLSGVDDLMLALNLRLLKCARASY
jgi:hypothetical protein